MKLFFFDTETTGLPAFKDPSDAPHQPHIVSATAIVVDTTAGKVLHHASMIVRPSGWEIPKETSDIHGITTEMAMDVGVDESLVTEVMLDVWRTAEGRIGHNQSFDARIIRIALKRYASELIADQWKEGPAECTMKMATPIVALPGNKWPTLSEAYQKIIGEPLENPHESLADTIGCMRIYYAMKELGRCPV